MRTWIIIAAILHLVAIWSLMANGHGERVEYQSAVVTHLSTEPEGPATLTSPAGSAEPEDVAPRNTSAPVVPKRHPEILEAAKGGETAASNSPRASEPRPNQADEATSMEPVVASPTRTQDAAAGLTTRQLTTERAQAYLDSGMVAPAYEVNNLSEDLIRRLLAAGVADVVLLAGSGGQAFGVEIVGNELWVSRPLPMGWKDGYAQRAVKLPEAWARLLSVTLSSEFGHEATDASAYLCLEPQSDCGILAAQLEACDASEADPASVAVVRGDLELDGHRVGFRPVEVVH